MRVVRSIRSIVQTLFVAVLVSSVASASDLVSKWQPAFGSSAGADGAVHAMIEFDDGTGRSLFCGGSFKHVGGVLASGVAAWDGRRWRPLGAGLGPNGSSNGVVWDLEVFDDGSGPAIYVCGAFSSAGGIAAKGLARWDGTQWSVFGVPAGPSNLSIQAMTVHDDGSGPALYVAGSFTSVSGVAAVGIAKFDGTNWSSLGSGVSGIIALESHDDGSGPALYAAGTFATAGGVPAAKVARWDGTSWSAVGTGFTVNVTDLATHDDGSGSGRRLYASASDTVTGVVRVWDGVTWTLVGSPLIVLSLGGYVAGLDEVDDGAGPALFVSGTRILGMMHGTVARLGAGAWSIVGGNAQGHGRCVAVGPGIGSARALYSGGANGVAGLNSNTNLLRFDAAAQAWTPAGGKALAGAVAALEVFDSGSGPEVHAGGTFSGSAAGPARHVARWDGDSWEPLGSGVDSGFFTDVRAMSVFDVGTGPRLIIGGSFAGVGGVVAANIASWNGSQWSPLGSGLNDTVAEVHSLHATDLGRGPELFVGGDFDVTVDSSGIPARSVASWNGQSWSVLGSGMNQEVSAFATFDAGTGPRLFAGGGFSTAGGVAALRIAQWDGSAWAPVGSGFNGSVRALTVFDDGTGLALFAGGTFTMAGTTTVNRIAKWNGQTWSPLGTGLNGDVRALVVHDDLSGDGPVLFVAGSFTTAGGVPANGLARWDGTSWSAPIAGGIQGVQSMIVQPDPGGAGSALLFGGFFPAIPDGYDSFVAKWACGGPCGGMTPFGSSCADGNGIAPKLSVTGCSAVGGIVTTRIESAHQNGVGLLLLGPTPAAIGLGSGCSLYVTPPAITIGPIPLVATATGQGVAQITTPISSSVVPGTAVLTAVCSDPDAPLGFTTTNGITLTLSP